MNLIHIKRSANKFGVNISAKHMIKLKLCCSERDAVRDEGRTLELRNMTKKLKLLFNLLLHYHNFYTTII
jgi:hypothetical protein